MAENLAHLISTSLGFGVVIALLLLLRRVLDGRFAPTWWRKVWTWLLVVMFLYLPARSFPTAAIPSPIELDTPQVVVDGAYDRYNTYLWDHENIVAAGSGGGGGAVTTTEDGNMWYRHRVHYEDAQGQDVTINDNDYLRSVTVDGTTTYTIHWTGVVYLVYAVVAVLLFAGGLVRYRLFRRRCLRWSTPAGAEDLAALEEQKQALSLEREVELYRCSLVHAPLLMGFLHPAILLPEGMPQGSLDTALAHELTHLKSHDTAQLLWASLARAVHWFNPMVWLLARQLHREMELCCDYNLLKDRDAAGRRAYGQAILDQMTAEDRGLSRLTTGFSGDKKEVFARFKAMMDTAPKRRGRIAMAAALVVVVLAGSLVGCQTGASTPEGDGAWIAGIDLEARTVTYYPLSQGTIDDQEALSEWIWGEDGMAVEEPRTVSLSEGAAFFHTYEGETYSIPASTLWFSLSMTQAGALGEVEVDGNEAVRVQLASAASLDLSAPDLDFTGYCGTVYAAGMGGVRLLEDGDTISVDPCTGEGYDSDHTYYTLPLAPDVVIPEADLLFLTGLSSAQYPAYWHMDVVDGQVTLLGGIGDAEGDGFCYDTSVPVKSAADVLSVTPISIPDTLTDLSYTVCGLLDDHTLLLKRYDSTVSDLSRWELGLYDWESGRYTRLIDDAELVNQMEVAFIGPDCIVLRLCPNAADENELNPAWTALALLDPEDGSLEYFFHIPEDSHAQLVYDVTGRVCGTDRALYFDEISLGKDGVLRTVLYRYDLESREVSLLLENAHSPMEYRGEIAVLIPGSDGTYCRLSDLSGNLISDIRVKLENFGLESGGDAIYCMEAAGAGKGEVPSVYQLTELLTGQTLLSCEEPISLAAATEDFVAWKNYTNELPCLYDAADGAVLRFDMAREGRNDFYLAQGCGILQNTCSYDAPDLYFFRHQA